MKGVESGDSAVAKRTRKILDTAAELFGRKGYVSTRMEDIAERAEVNKATIYYHLGTKPELYRRILQGPLEDVRKELETLEPEEEPSKHLGTVLHTVLEQLGEHPELPSILLRALAGDGTDLPPRIQDTIGVVLDTLRDIIEQGQSEGTIREVRPHVIQKVLMGALLVSSGAEDFLNQVSNCSNQARSSLTELVELLQYGFLTEGEEP